ncbi:RNA polymerase I-specific transcription initiation factor RRN3 [Teleopsis dalmanni]|uniref:RNA polymerase I-specific transcription initiation factor RRN3 n=1 Tax=Teleopsis dalmanni TaxID=139649 RepID=UPI0018CF2FF8|nr:RNA polymerase I-specific transcription initiation factor RRN3 [Teleopsis dalmanni]
MSVYSAKTGISSILKSYSTSERDQVKNSIINNVRFNAQKTKSLSEAVSAVSERNYNQPMNDFIEYLQKSDIDNANFIRIFSEARSIVHILSPKFSSLVEALLKVSWNKRSPEAISIYTSFFIDLMIAHSKYIVCGIETLVSLWIPTDIDEYEWPKGVPNEDIKLKLKPVHCLIERLIDLIPMVVDTILDAVDKLFPYYKKPAYVVAGFVYNTLWLLSYQPAMIDCVLVVLLHKLITLDVNAPRAEIEDTDCVDMDEDEEIFDMDEIKSEKPDADQMSHPIAHTLDICMKILFDYFEAKCGLTNYEFGNKPLQISKEGQILFTHVLNAFNSVILISHNTHHVQFLIFFYCSLKNTFAECFLATLWNNVKNLNTPSVLKQTSVGYIVSFLARSKYLPIALIQFYLKEFCNWAHQYIQRSDRRNSSLKAHIVFFTICQAIFYIIAFRSRALTKDKKDLVFLQSLQLSGLVTSNFNPLRVCLPAVATAFAAVTRSYQLAYCHAILERNARRRLATVYINETETPEETLDTFFPFDPYLLKDSGKRIEPIYLEYQAHEAEENSPTTTNIAQRLTRKRGDSEMVDECDVDDFILRDKRHKVVDIPKYNHELEAQFTYSTSPGFC